MAEQHNKNNEDNRNSPRNSCHVGLLLTGSKQSQKKRRPLRAPVDPVAREERRSLGTATRMHLIRYVGMMTS